MRNRIHRASGGEEAEIEHAQLNAKSKEARAAIIKERNQVLEDLEAAVELVRGTYGLPANPHAFTSRAMRTMKHYNALTNYFYTHYF